ncbi:MAG: trehalose-phosphatase [Actinomycetota bacterium]
MTDLDDGLGLVAQTPQLLVACDYDGTVAPLVDDPMAAEPNRATVVALRTLAELPLTYVAVISGRSLRDLAALSRLPTEVHLVGSHGSEWDIGFGRELTDEQHDLRRQIKDDLAAIADETPGARLETKPAAVAFHYREVDPATAEEAIARIEAGAAGRPGVRTHRSDHVIELLVIDTDKGEALDALRARVGATAVLFIGDSAADEGAFRTLRGPDIGIRVGEGDTSAEYRVDDTEVVSHTLAKVADLRTDWVAGAGAVPIEDHALLSDQRTAALVTPGARVTWLCAPRIDSAAVFAELVGGPPAGFFSIAPSDGSEPTGQRYLDDTLVLETTWADLSVTDYLDVGEGRTDRLAGRTDLVRTVRGSGSVRIEFAPRLDFGRYETRLRVRDDGVEVVGAADLMALRAPGVEWELADDGRHHTATATVALGDEPLVLEFRCGTASLKPSTTDAPVRQSVTAGFWSAWAGQLDRCTVEPELVERSALTLKALCYGPTGAIVAAPTTSLPETIGGVRNWDYRYCWLRDAALSAAALVRLGSYSEAMGFLDWVLRVLDQRSDDPSRLHPLYLVTGRHLPPEADIAELPGYAGSRPVRVGNAAERQVQLDVFGPVVDLIALLGETGAPLSSEHWRLVQAMVSAVDQRWDEPDHGIWEARRPPRHHVYSKTMCWVTVDRALKVAGEFVDDDHEDWQDLRSRIADDVLTRGWKDEVGSFSAAYDGTDLDASTLAVGLWGLLEPGDDRFEKTVGCVEQALREGPTVYRYHYDDGLPGREGGFHLMTSWLIDAYLLVGRLDDAKALFTDLTDRVGGTGLLSEEYDPATGRALGNHPQAYSHLGLINNALNLEAALD